MVTDLIGGMILITVSTLTGAMILSATIAGTRLFTSISVSETYGIIITTDGMAVVITAIGIITGQVTIHTMIVMAIIITQTDIQLQDIHRDGIQATIPDLFHVIIYREEIIHQLIRRVIHSVIIT